jgi:DNA-binding response OmpR family regulator
VHDRYGAAALPFAGSRPLRALLAVPRLQLATGLTRALLSVGLLPTLAFTVNDVSAYLEADSFAIVVLHLGEPDPRSLVAEVRRRSRAPILALGAERQPREPIWSLRCEGYAPDTLPPLDLARRAVELALDPQPPWQDLRGWPMHSWGPLRLNSSRRLACWHGTPISLTSMQFRLLLVLVQARGGVVSSIELSRRVWGTDLPQDTARVVAHIRRIRKLIEADPAHPRFLLAIRGEGFRLADSEQDWPADMDPLSASAPRVP